MDLFKVLNSCIKGPRASDEDIAQLSSWMLVRWLSGDPRTVGIANALNVCYNMPIQAQYDFVRMMLHGKIRFIKFPKSVRNNDDALHREIASRYRCNPALVPELLDLMDDEEKKEYLCAQ